MKALERVGNYLKTKFRTIIIAVSFLPRWAASSSFYLLSSVAFACGFTLRRIRTRHREKAADAAASRMNRPLLYSDNDSNIQIVKRMAAGSRARQTLEQWLDR